MDVPFAYPSGKTVTPIEPSSIDSSINPKSKSQPIQMYISSPNPSGYSLGTPSPPLTALSSRSLSNNNSSTGQSLINGSQYASQSSQVQHQTSHNNQNQRIQQHRQNVQAGSNQQELQHQMQHQHGLHQLKQHQHQRHESPSHVAKQNQSEHQPNFAQYAQQQKRPSSQGFNFHDTGIDGRHHQGNGHASAGSSLPNGGTSHMTNNDRINQSAHSYSAHDSSVQDPQLRHLYHLQTQQVQSPVQLHRHQQHHNHNQYHDPYHPQLKREQQEQQDRSLSIGHANDPRLQNEIPHDRRSIQIHGDAVLQATHFNTHPQLNQSPQNLGGSMHLQRSSLGPESQSPMGFETTSNSANSTLTIISKLVSGTSDNGGKKKRGRPKKLILDPSTNQYIDSAHENFKKLNKLLKESSDITVKHSHSPLESGLKLDALNEQEMKQLLESKDRRGRPRKFPIEQTGITIKGIRVNGTMKGKKKSLAVSSESTEKVQKKKRGRPRRETSTVV